MGTKTLFGFLFVILLASASTLSMADTSDYIWNQQFAKKMGLAEQGDAKAQYDVGKMLQKGQGTGQNSAEAFKWFSKAAKQGHIRAGYKVGAMYHKGEGVAKNNAQAFKWVKKAADNNYAPAMFYLGQLYARGAGTPKDLNKALGWYQKANAKGYHPAKGAIVATKRQIADAAPPPPPQRRAAVAAPAPRPAAKPAPRKKAAKPASKPATGKTNVLASVIGNTWKHEGKPATEFPSESTSCSVANNRIICNSAEMEVEEPYGTVSYKVESMIGNFKGKEFSNQYRRNVTMIIPSEPDNPDVIIPIDYGPQQPELMRCKMIGKGITCTTQDKKTKSYKKS
jgi:hypothetical protein